MPIIWSYNLGLFILVVGNRGTYENCPGYIKKIPVLRLGGFQQFEKSQFSWPIFSYAESQNFQEIFFGIFFLHYYFIKNTNFEYIFSSL
jgi:hypothetical protein